LRHRRNDQGFGETFCETNRGFGWFLGREGNEDLSRGDGGNKWRREDLRGFDASFLGSGGLFQDGW